MKRKQSFIQTALFVLAVVFALASTSTSEKCVTAKELETVNSKIIFQNEKVAQQKDMILHLTEKLRRHETKIAKIQQTMPETKNQFSSLGCLDDVLSQSCPDNRLIYITYAEYGQHYLACSEACCAPNPQYDCTEDVATNAEEVWFYIKYLCDNKTSCSYEYNGATISECAPGYIADYLQIFYDCNPEPTELVVGFTAWASAIRSYQANQIVLFDQVDSNFGGHFNPTTSTFNCPYHGTYLFGVNILGDLVEQMFTIIMKESSILATAYADKTASTYNQGSALVFTECLPGQVVWVKSSASGVMYGDNVRYSHMSGYLMQRLD